MRNYYYSSFHEIFIFSPTTSTTVAIVATTTLMMIYLLVHQLKYSKRVLRSPPVPAGSLPIIGHLRVLGGADKPHVALSKLADEYGPIFKISVGTREIVVVSNSELAKKVLQTQDKELAGRPRLVSFDILSYNYAMFGFTHASSDYWREMRKISAHELLSTHRLGDLLNQVKMNEVWGALKETHDKWVVFENNTSNNTTAGVVEEMKEWFDNVTLNMMTQVVVGKSLCGKYSNDMDVDADRWLKALNDFFHLVGVFTVADAFPYLKWLDIGGHEKVMKKAAKELDLFAQGLLDSHRSERALGVVKDKKNMDFMEILIGIFEKPGAKTFQHDADTIIKALCMSLILGGAHAISASITWALCLLLNNPHTLKMVMQELDEHVGQNKKVEESDMKKLVYLQAVTKETLRLYPPAPLSVPHEAMSDVTIADYDILTGTQVFVNLYKIQRDPHVWGDPLEFRPERFLTTHKDIDLKGRHFDFIPFSSGRRVCPGISYTLQVMPFTLATLLHAFNVATLDNGPVDVTEEDGITSVKATPLLLALTPRQPAHLYHQ